VSQLEKALSCDGRNMEIVTAWSLDGHLATACRCFPGVMEIYNRSEEIYFSPLMKLGKGSIVLKTAC
jgi:hypothetical protein